MITVTLIVAVIAFTGGFLLEVFRRRSTDRRWLFDRRHEAYLAFVHEVNAFQAVVYRMKTPEDLTPERVQELMDMGPGYEAAAFSVRMLGSESAERLAFRAYRLHTEILTSINGRLPPLQARKELGGVLHTFMALVRIEFQQPGLRPWFKKGVISGLIEKEGREASVSPPG